MTPQEVRDKLAELAGWTRVVDGSAVYWVHHGRGRASIDHPIPADSIDVLRPLWPEGWWWERNHEEWIGHKSHSARVVRVPDTGNFPDDFARLTLAVNMEARK